MAIVSRKGDLAAACCDGGAEVISLALPRLTAQAISQCLNQRIGLGDDEAVKLARHIAPVPMHRIAHLLPERFVLFDGAA